MTASVVSFDNLMFFLIFAGAALTAATLCMELSRFRRDRRAQARRDALHRSLFVHPSSAVAAADSPASMADVLPFRHHTGSSAEAAPSTVASSDMDAAAASSDESPRRRRCGLGCR